MGSTPSSWGTKVLTKWAPQMQQGRPWQSASKPQGGLNNKCIKGIVRTSWVSWWYSSRYNDYRHKGVNRRNMCATNANCIVLPTSTGAKGCTLNAMTATIITISMADASSTISATTAVVADKLDNKKSPLRARTRASSPDAYMLSMPITHTTSAVLTCATKRANNNNSQAATTTKKHSRGGTCTTRHTRDDCWTNSKSSCLAEPGTRPQWRKNKCASDDNKKYHVG